MTHKETGKNWIDGSGVYYYDIIGIQRIWRYLREYCSLYFDWSVNDYGRMDYPDSARDMEFSCVKVCAEIVGRGVRVVFRPKDDVSFSEYGNAKEITAEYIPLGNRIRVVLKIVGKSETPFVESGNFRLLLNTDGRATYRFNKVGSIVDPSQDIVLDANHNIYCLENWLDVSEKNAGGLMIVSHDAPLFSFGRDNVYRTDRRYRKPKRAEIHFNLFNNMWGTNFPQWIGGNFTYEFDLIPHGENVEEAERQAYALINHPILLHTDRKFASCLKAENAEISSVFDCGDHICVRVRETTGKNVKVKLQGALLNGKSVDKVDLYGRVSTTDFCRSEGDVVSFPLPANGFATIEIKK